MHHDITVSVLREKKTPPVVFVIQKSISRQVIPADNVRAADVSCTAYEMIWVTHLRCASHKPSLHREEGAANHPSWTTTLTRTRQHSNLDHQIWSSDTLVSHARLERLFFMHTSTGHIPFISRHTIFQRSNKKQEKLLRKTRIRWRMHAVSLTYTSMHVSQPMQRNPFKADQE